jgi:hypothetical protein
MVAHCELRSNRQRTSGHLRSVGLALVCALTLLFLAGTAAAQAPTATIDVAPTATLNSDGSLTVTVILTCVPLDEYKGLPLAEVVVAQERGQNFARGSGGALVTDCDNTPHTYDLIVMPDEGSPRFRPGPATARPIVGICGFLNGTFVCQSADSTEQTIVIRPTYG